MTALRSGIDHIRSLILDELSDEHRKVKIVHIDFDWDFDSSDIAGCIQPLTSVEVGDRWLSDPELGYVHAIHGTSCAAIAKRNGTLSEKQLRYWNLAPFTDLFALPVRKSNFARIPNEAPLVAADFAASKAIDEVIRAKLFGQIAEGDIVVATIAVSDPRQHDPTGQNTPGETVLPIIHLPRTRERIRVLTCDHRVIFVAAAGNGNKNLGQVMVDAYDEPVEPFLYQNNGSSCGAVLVGSNLNGALLSPTNYGNCVDAFAPGMFTERMTGSQNSATEAPDGVLKLAWSMTSSSAVYVACQVAAIQQLRVIRGLHLYRPYEVRAHLRQWTMPHHQVPAHGAPSSDVLSWAIGTSVISPDEVDWDQMMPHYLGPYRQSTY